MDGAHENGSAFPDGHYIQESRFTETGLDNPGFDEDFTEEPAPKTIVSFVFDPSHERPEDLDNGPSWSEIMRLFSGIYSIMLILLGLGFPLAEATGEDWLEEAYIGAFYAYLYVGAMAFLIYCQVLLSLPEKEDSSVLDGPYEKGYIIRSPDIDEKLHRLSTGVQNNWSMAAQGDEKPIGKEENPPEQKKHIATVETPEHADHRYIPAIQRLRSESGSKSQKTTSTDSHSHGSMRCRRRGSEFAAVMSNKDELGNDVHVIDLSGQQGNINLHLNERRKSSELDVELMDMEGFKGMFSHEGSSFYLRMGALLFGIGNVIYVVMELEYNYSRDCPTPSMAWIFFFQLAFILVQTFFIFKNPKIHLTRGVPTARLGFMHLVATNMCVWIRTLISEISEQFRHASESHGNETAFADPEDDCGESAGLVSSVSPYLFPFVLEYSLIAMATAAVMYDYLGIEDDKLVIQNIRHAIKSSDMKKHSTEGITSSSESNVIAHEEQNILAKSHKGVFLAMLVFSGLAISTVFVFFAKSDDFYSEPYVIFYASDAGVSTLLLTSALIAFSKCRHLAYRTAKPLSIDDLLILISMCGSFMFELSILVSSADTLMKDAKDDHRRLIMAVVSSSLAAVETVIQVVFILAGMRMYAAQEKHQRDMPGRGAVAFMLLANVSVWLFRSIEIREIDHSVQMEFFGFEAWTVILNIFLPLLLFYRFHSSVCLADIWQVAYRPLYH